MDGDMGIAIGVSVLTATIDRALDDRTRCLVVRSADGDIRVINPCQHIVGIHGRRACGLGHITARGTEDHTVLLTVDTNRTAGDGDVGDTRFPNTCILVCRGIVGVGSHRTVGTATIYIMVYGTARDIHIGVTLDEAGPQLFRVTLTTATAINVTNLGTTTLNGNVTYLAACNRDVGIRIHAT